MSTTRPIAATLLALLLAACGGDGAVRNQPTAPATSAEPTGTASEEPSPATSPTSASPTPVGTMQTTVYYLHDLERGPRLQKEVRTVPRSTATLRAAIDAMLHLAPLDPDYKSLWPKTTKIRGVSISGDTATIDLSKEAEDGNAGSEFEAMSLQQLVWTATAVSPAIKRVKLLVEGRQGESLWGHSSYQGTMVRDDHNGVLAPISIESPRQGVTTSGRKITFRGSSNTFEANLLYRITRAPAPGTTASPGQPVYAQGHTTATAGTGTRGTWTVTLTLPAAASGNWVEIRAYEASAMDGSEQFADTKVVRIP